MGFISTGNEVFVKQIWKIPLILHRQNFKIENQREWLKPKDSY
jgi:hypothetical protein